MPVPTQHPTKATMPNCHSSRISSHDLEFKNDNTSRKALISKRDQAENLAAAEAAKQSETERIQKELQELHELRISFAELKSELKNKTEKVESLNYEAARTQDEIKRLEALSNSLSQESQKNKQELKALQDEIERNRLPVMNNLPLGFHEEGFVLLNCQNRLALDFAADNGTRCHGWPFDHRNWSQHVKFNKVNIKDPKSAWTINCKGKYLEFTHPNDHARLSSRNTSSQNQEWYIGNLPNRPGRYTIWNVEHKCYLTLKDNSDKPGCYFIAVSQDKSSSTQNFIPITVVPFYP
ncbi:hypothetical protein FBEOM_4510 [Fusarium beomiforme]|uniref:Uncharacterized protein n=1 Tax=Fusarium beomiforme TaxID=44412 RepID=A0A9P5E0Y8_9HYPO|nr:hypothetical protein FBEOM_4510 [Fusarium beomiforme]